jgi:hypothetical protein
MIPSPSEDQIKNAKECWPKTKKNLETGGWLNESEFSVLETLVENYFKGKEMVRVSDIAKEKKLAPASVRNAIRGDPKAQRKGRVESGCLERKGLTRPEQLEEGEVAHRMTPWAFDFLYLLSNAPETSRVDYCITVIVARNLSVCLVKPTEESRDKSVLFKDWSFPALDSPDSHQDVITSIKAAKEQAGCAFVHLRTFDDEECSSILVGTGYGGNKFIQRTPVVKLGTGSKIMDSSKSKDWYVKWVKKDEIPDPESTATLAEKNLKLSEVASDVFKLPGFWDDVAEVAKES